ncbi:hypothetical protein BDY24DRAFT_400877 [Mrakia frigida]|uniref:uncharacterized protein n=1 Tax=Mrakia frigida TaxID=29902 RepID=UPI003FCC273C
MSPTILVIGATGNTGRSVTSTLSKLLDAQAFNVLALTRSATSDVSKQLAALPNVRIVEKDWTEIDSAWLKDNNVKKAFVASHNAPSQYTEESGLHLALLEAGVNYVVRISTNDSTMGPTSRVYYGRTHWAIENLLSQPEFKPLRWTSLRPNVFSVSLLASEAAWVKTYRSTGELGQLNITFDKDAKVGIIDPYDVGVVAGTLLALSDASQHNNKRYILSGPEDYSGADVVSLVERVAGVKIPEEKITFRYTAWINEMASNGFIAPKLIPSFLAIFVSLWDG